MGERDAFPIISIHHCKLQSLPYFGDTHQYEKLILLSVDIARCHMLGSNIVPAHVQAHCVILNFVFFVGLSYNRLMVLSNCVLRCIQNSTPLHSSEFHHSLAELFLETAYAGVVSNMPRRTNEQKTGHGIPTILKSDLCRRKRFDQVYREFLVMSVSVSHWFAYLPAIPQWGHMYSADKKFMHNIRIIWHILV